MRKKPAPQAEPNQDPDVAPVVTHNLDVDPNDPRNRDYTVDNRSLDDEDMQAPAGDGTADD